MPVDYTNDTNELIEIIDPMDALYEHLDAIDAEQQGSPQMECLLRLVQFLNTLPTFLSVNPGVRNAVTEGALLWTESDHANLRMAVEEFLAFLGSLRNRDDYLV